jgi:hypothetical protein
VRGPLKRHGLSDSSRVQPFLGNPTFVVPQDTLPIVHEFASQHTAGRPMIHQLFTQPGNQIVQQVEWPTSFRILGA